MLTKNAIGNLINRYKSVLKKCALLNACAFSLILTPCLGYAKGSLDITDASQWTQENAENYTEWNIVADHVVHIGGNLSPHNLTINGNNSTLTMSSTSSTHTIFIVRPDCNLTLNNLIIEGFHDIPIYNDGGTITFSGSTFKNNAVNSFSVYGPLHNDSGVLRVENSLFDSDTDSVSGAMITRGRAISNLDRAYVTGSLFTNNTTETGWGGAIYNQGTMEITGSEFKENKAFYGGAIINVMNEMTVTNSHFTNNTASSAGGAIFNNTNATLNIVAQDGESTFTGNKLADGTSNSLYNQGTINFQVNSNGVITLNDAILNAGDSATINIEEIRPTAFSADTATDGTNEENTGGKVILNTSISGGDVNLNSATLILGLYESESNTTSNFDNTVDLALNGGTIDMLNNVSQIQTPKSINLTSTVHATADVDLASKTMDSFAANEYTNTGGTLNITNMNIMSDSELSVTDVLFTDGGVLTTDGNGVRYSETTATGPVYTYHVEYVEYESTAETLTEESLNAGSEITEATTEGINGYFRFTQESTNPEVLSADVAAANLSIFQNEIYTRLFRMHNATKARIENKEEGSAFMSVFGGDENLDLDNFDRNVDLKTMGTIAGYEGARQEFAFDTDAFFSLYGAYVRGESDFADTELDQNAYYLGAGANFYRGDAYLLSTALVSVADNQLNGTSYDSFASYTTGLGLQGGYVFDLGYDFKLQPNIFASFTYIHSEAWTTERNADISSGDFYEFRVSPGLRLDKQFSPESTGYAFGRYVHIEVDGTSMTANDIDLPDVDLKPYVEYGLGFSKEMENLVFFVEGLYRNGGREGWEGQVGFKYAW